MNNYDMESKINILKKLLEERLPTEDSRNAGIDGVGIFRINSSFKKRPELYKTQIIILAQGQKRLTLGNKTYTYDPQTYYVQAVPLPVACEAVIKDDKPMLGIAIEIDPQIIGEIIYEMKSEPITTQKVKTTLYSSPMDNDFIDPVIRLMRSLDSENEKRILSPLYLKEIIFRVITGKNGEILRELALNNRGFYQVSRIINKIHHNLGNTYDVQNLAKDAGMSSTAFYTIFKEMTSSSPLQYIKNVRLHKAKELIEHEREKANIAATIVGYESYSQFSREFKRCFGLSPAQVRN